MNSNDYEYLVLGAGYVGSYFSKITPRVLCTYRSKNDDLNARSVKFNLNDKNTWENIPVGIKNVLWTFSVAQSFDEIKIAQEFFETKLSKSHVIIYSSTSCYITTDENQIVDELTPINTQNTRFMGEEVLRQKGALILCLSGIVGPNRNPKNWYQKGLVKYGQNILNYIHLNDIVYFTKLMFEHFEPCQRFNLTSGDYKTHKEISKSMGLNTLFDNENDTFNSKRVDNQKILKFLNLCDYKFEHIY